MARLVLTVCDQITCNDFCLCSECSKLKGMESKVFSEFALKKMIELFQYPSKALIPTNLSSPRFFGIAEEKMSINPGNYKLSDKTGKLTAQGNQFFIIFSVSYVFIGASESRYSKRKPAFQFYEVRSCFIKYKSCLNECLLVHCTRLYTLVKWYLLARRATVNRNAICLCHQHAHSIYDKSC